MTEDGATAFLVLVAAALLAVVGVVLLALFLVYSLFRRRHKRGLVWWFGYAITLLLGAVGVLILIFSLA